MGMGSYDSLVW